MSMYVTLAYVNRLLIQVNTRPGPQLPSQHRVRVVHPR